MMILTELIGNALYPNPTEIAFAKRRTPDTQRDAFFHVESSSEEFSLRLKVFLNGNITSSTCNRNGFISNACHERPEEWCDVIWADTGNIAIIKTEISKGHLEEGIEAPQVMQTFINSITTESDAVCPGGYANWQLQMQIFINMISQKRGIPVEMDMILPRTICPGQEYARPWRSPHIEINAIEGDRHTPLKLSPAEEKQLREINEACYPRSSSLMLNPPLMIRNPTREIFHSEPV